MPLGPYMMRCVVSIVGMHRPHETADLKKMPLGTGFFLLVPNDTRPQDRHCYLVTANHVIEGKDVLELAIPDAAQPGAMHPTVVTDGPDWIHPIDELDLAFLPFERPEAAWIGAFEVGTNLLQHLPVTAMLGAPVYYIGLLEPLNLMMARSGTIGAVDLENVDHGYVYKYRTHLADCRSYQGFSGSPCIVEYVVPTLKEVVPPVPMPKEFGPPARLHYLHLLCGIFTEHLERPRPGGEVSRPGVGFILSSDEIWRALYSERMVKHRRESAKTVQDSEIDRDKWRRSV